MLRRQGGLDIETFEEVLHAYVMVHTHWWDHLRISQENILRVIGLGVAHEAISPQTIRKNEQYFAEEVLPARVAQLEKQFPGKVQGFFEKVITSWADIFTQRIARGTGLTLIQTELPSDERKELERALLPTYHTQLIERGIKDYSIEDCLADYRLSVLANIPHALVWESHSYLESAMRAFRDWECNEMLV